MSKKRLEDYTKEELKAIEEKIGWIMEIYWKGGIFPLKAIKRFQEDERQYRTLAVKERFKRVTNIEKGVFPVNPCIIFDISRMRSKTMSIERIIKFMIIFVDEESIYMYNPDGKGTGYRYYKGEKIIVYQIGSFLTRNERCKMEGQIRRTEFNGYKKEVFKIVITEERLKILSEWPVFKSSTIAELKESFLKAWNGRILSIKKNQLINE